MVTLTSIVATAVLAVVQSADSITLAQALERARATRPQIAGGAATVERARGARRVGLAIPNPATQLESDDDAPTRKFTVSQQLAWIPRRWADLAAGAALVDRATADSAQLVADVARDVRRSFYGALAAEERLRLVSEQAALADSLVVLADRRVSAGDISALERDQVAQEAAQARLVAARAREGVRVASIELARALAWNGSDPPHPVGQLGDGLDAEAGEVARAAAGSEGAGAELSSVPALRAVVADPAGSAARLRAARLAQIPVPAVVVGREWGGDPTLRRNAILGLSMPFPFWSQGREAVAEARGAAGESAARLAEARLSIAAQVEAAHVRVAETAARARFARDTLLPEARRIRAGAVRLYDAGRTGIFPVFDALRVERDISQTVVQELLAFQEARADLVARLGRWQ